MPLVLKVNLISSNPMCLTIRTSVAFIVSTNHFRARKAAELKLLDNIGVNSFSPSM